MIFSRQHANAIAKGWKTTHHSMVRALSVGARVPVSVRTPNEAQIVCYVRIAGMEWRGLRDLTRIEAKHEGYDGSRGPLNWRRAWLEEHDKAWAWEQAKTDRGLTDELVAERFHRHKSKPVHVLTLELVEEPDQWMARSSGRLTAHQTTGNPHAAIDELPVPPQEFVDGLAKKANETRTATQAQARREAAAADFAQALAKARAAGKSTTNAIRHVERITRSLNRVADTP